MPIFRDKTEESNYFEELEFWQIPYKDESYNKTQNEFDSEWYASTLILEYNNTTVKKHSTIIIMLRFAAWNTVLQRCYDCY